MIRFIITCLFTPSTVGQAEDIYVTKPDDFTPTNRNVNDVVPWKSGSPDVVSGMVFGTNAFTTVTEATSVTISGDTVYIASGTYQEAMNIVIFEGVNFAVDGPGLTILDGEPSRALFSLYNRPTTIKDLTIQNGFSD